MKLTPEQIAEGLEGLFAYDMGATDSGVHDPVLKRQLAIHIWRTLDEEQNRLLLSKITRDLFLSDEAIAKGYGWEDAKQFLEWLEDDLASSGAWTEP